MHVIETGRDIAERKMGRGGMEGRSITVGERRVWGLGSEE